MGQSFWLKSQSGNYSGDTFDPTKKYVGVRLQQDVELLDRDWNELEDIRRYEEVILRKWYIGNGTPNDGFKISQVEDPRDFNISPGRCQVDGFEAVNDTGIFYSDQNDPETQNSLPDLTIPQGERSDTVYLDISIREISGLEDPDLMNPQDLTHETCRRHKIEWLVRVDEGRGVGSTEPFNKEDFHYYYDIARIDRDGAQVSISDLRRTKLAVYLLKDSLDALGDLSASLNDLKGSANNLKILVDGLQSSQDALTSSQNNLENTVNDLNVSVNSLTVAQNDSSNSINALKISQSDLNNSVNVLKRSQGDLNISVNALKSSQNALTEELAIGKIADGLHSHSLLVGSNGSPDPALMVDSNGNVGIGIQRPSAPLHVAGYLTIGPFSTGPGHHGPGTVDLTGNEAQIGFSRNNMTSWPDNPQPGDRFVWYNPDGSARLFTQVKGDLLCVTKDGNVGVGTNSPNGKLEVSGDILAGNSDLYFTKTDHNWTGFGNTPGYAAIENAADYGALMILGRAGTPKGRYVRLWDYLQVNGGMDVTGKFDLGNSDLYFTKTDHNWTGFGNTPGYAAIENAADYGSLMILGRAGTPKGRYVRLWDYLQVNGGMDVIGWVGIGTDNPRRPLHVEGLEIHSGGYAAGISFANVGGPNNGKFVDNGGDPAGQRWVWWSFDRSARLWSGIDRLVVGPDGTVRASRFIPPSDARFKTDIAPLTDVLTKLEKIQGVSFKWNGLGPYGHSGKGREIGLIAQEVEAVFPELIATWGNENYKGIDYDRLTGVLVEAIKELKAENESFGRKIKALEDAELRSRVGISS